MASRGFYEVDEGMFAFLFVCRGLDTMMKKLGGCSEGDGDGEMVK